MEDFLGFEPRVVKIIEKSTGSLCELCPDIFLTTEEKARKTSVRVAEECQLPRWKQNMQKYTEHT